MEGRQGEPDTHDVLVTQVRSEAQDVVSVVLSPADGKELPGWAPGAHIDLTLPSGKVRQYSLCGSPADRGSYTIAVLHERTGRGGSRELHEGGLAGRRLRLRGPRNHFALVDAEHYLFLAGGIGVTPLVPMVQRIAATGASWELWYGGRSRSAMPFADRLKDLGPERVHLLPQDEAGTPPVRDLVERAPTHAAIYCCGPAAMIRAVADACAGAGRTGDLHVERFGPVPAPDTEETPADRTAPRPFTVELRRSRRVLAVPVGRTLLDVVRDVVPAVPYSCEDGYCGSCETRVLAGTPEHHDTVLSDDERRIGETMMICVGRARGERLVLDL